MHTASSGRDGLRGTGWMETTNSALMSGFRFVIAVLCSTSILLFAVYLRNANNRLFYELSMEHAEQSRLSQTLGAKQLRLESMINPAAVSERLDE